MAFVFTKEHMQQVIKDFNETVPLNDELDLDSTIKTVAPLFAKIANFGFNDEDIEQIVNQAETMLVDQVETMVIAPETMVVDQVETMVYSMNLYNHQDCRPTLRQDRQLRHQ
jgi:hypothetical protein